MNCCVEENLSSVVVSKRKMTPYLGSGRRKKKRKKIIEELF